MQPGPRRHPITLANRQPVDPANTSVNAFLSFSIEMHQQTPFWHTYNILATNAKNKLSCIVWAHRMNKYSRIHRNLETIPEIFKKDLKYWPSTVSHLYEALCGGLRCCKNHNVSLESGMSCCLQSAHQGEGRVPPLLHNFLLHLSAQSRNQ